MVSVFTLIAIVLASVGVYGTMAQTIAKRRLELAVRIAIGASISDVIKPIAITSFILAAIGILTGLVVAFGLARFINAMLFNVSWHDPGAYMFSAGIILLTVMLSGIFPAFRASRINPAAALKDD